MKSPALDFSGTVNPIPASNGSVWSLNSAPAKTSPASMRSMSSAPSPKGAMPKGSPASMTASNRVRVSFGWQKSS